MNLIQSIISQPPQIIRRNRNFIRLSAILVVVGLLLGIGFREPLQQFMQSQLEHIKNLAQQTNGTHSELAKVILLNNIKASVMLILFGVFFSLYPIFGLTVNGMVIGYLFASLNPAAGIPLWALIVFGILPHGILEIPAFILAGAMGIKLGYMWLRPIVGSSRWQSFAYAAKETLFLFPLILVMLVVAATIEGFITPELLSWYMK
jgi:stage II sporulation protein M